MKLEGRTSDWRERRLTSGRRHYTNLPPGNYRFRVMACNNSGVWNEEGAFLDFSIAPTFYQRTSFRVLVRRALSRVALRGLPRSVFSNCGVRNRSFGA